MDKDVAVGSFVLLGLTALVFLALKAGNMGGLNFAPSYAIRASFDNIGGLKVRAPVKSAGVVVGRVAEISLNPGTFQAEVSMQIDGDMRFPVDSSAKILTSGLLGEQYIGLEAGGDTRTLKEGDLIRMTQSAVVLESLIGQFLYRSAADVGAGDKR
jgi:phospholipid/cholesterol/gamma-HCH transport system substrate-binding protein